MAEKANKKLKLRVNIGTADILRFGLEDQEAKEGCVVELDDKAAEVFLSKKWAEPTEK